MVLSIVIPVYQVEKFIYQCLESIFSQRMEENWFEVIVVNDGTQDRSMDIVAQFARHKNLSVLNQMNQGLSVARNNGLLHAKGKYVWFVDSDDWLEGDALNIVRLNIENHPDVDVFASVLMMNYEKNGKREIEYKPNPNVMSGHDYMFHNHNANRGACQRYIFKHSFLQKYDLRFMPRVFHEDGEFSNRMLYLAKSLMIIPKPIYNYRIRESGSIMSSRNMKANEDLVKIYFSLRDFAEKYVKGNEDYWPYRYIIYQCLESTVEFSRKEIFSPSFNEFYQLHKKLIKSEARTILHHFTSLRFSENIKLLQYSIFPKLEIQIRQIVKKILIKFN